MSRIKRNHTLLSFSMVAVLGLFSFFGTSETPKEAVERFVKIFTAGRAEAFIGIIHPDIVEGKEIGTAEAESFLDRFKGRSLLFEGFRVKERLKSEDGKTERFRAVLDFKSSPISRNYPGPTRLVMILQWVSEEGRWWLERPLSIYYRVESSQAFPSPVQDMTAMRFTKAVQILEKLGLPGKEDLAFCGIPTYGTAVDDYRELEKLFKSERGRKGVAWRARGVKVMLRGAARGEGGLLRIYHGDFKRSDNDRRGPVPWEMFRDYVQAAVLLAKNYRARGEFDRAGKIYQRIISLGRQFLNEPGGLNFLIWGVTFQKIGASELAQLPDRKGFPPAKDVEAFLRLTSRKLDLLRTALSSLDEMADYGALKAAITAARRTGDPYFRPWGINTLAILSIKGAPANAETVKAAQFMVLVENPQMKRIAARALRDLESNPSDPEGSFIRYQKNWILNHRVYGAAPLFN
jgi:tetratricopeptide (TPR) repeat protein